MRSANATLDVFENEKLMEAHPQKAAAIAKGLESISNHKWVKNIRHTGIIAAFDLIDPEKNSKKGYLNNAGWVFYEEAKKSGALIRPLGNVIYFALPMTVTVDEIETLFKIVNQTLKNAFK
ncbi:MAG: aspartate aminotransferase family protein [Deltaproteobacteria bacterium]|nr:aspartate aminotransferase family protein [Deltaproteobacteria bacterium]